MSKKKKKKKSSLYVFRLPLIIKEILGKELYKEMSDVIQKSPIEREFVIYCSPRFEEAIEKALDEEIKRLIKK